MVEKKLKGLGPLVSIGLIIVGLILWNKLMLFWWVGAVVAAIGVVSLAFSVDWRRVGRIIWKIRADSTVFTTYVPLGTVKIHEVVRGRKVIRGVIDGDTFAVEVSDSLYDNIKDGDRVKVSAIEYRFAEAGKPRGVLRHRVWVGLEKVQEGGED